MNSMVGQIGAVVVAAGLSTRMGTPKQLLPWDEGTVIETVVANLDAAGVRPVVCVVGHLRQRMEAALAGTPSTVVFNESYAEVEMLHSYQVGIIWLTEDEGCSNLTGTLLSLGDQPHVGPRIIRRVIEAAIEAPNNLIIPSHNMRRGHPIYVPRTLWTELLSLGKNDSLRILIDKHRENITYVTIDDDVILEDMDTPAAYERLRAQTSSRKSS